MLEMDVHAIASFVGLATVITPSASEALPTDDEIAQLAQRLGVRFPDDYVAFLRNCGSLLVQVRPEVWPPPQPNDIGPRWLQTRFSLRVFGLCKEVTWMNVEPETATFREETGTALVPVFQWPNEPDATCFDASGKLVHWTPDSVAPVEASFAVHLERLLLEQRNYREPLLQRFLVSHG